MSKSTWKARRSFQRKRRVIILRNKKIEPIKAYFGFSAPKRVFPVNWAAIQKMFAVFLTNIFWHWAIRTDTYINNFCLFYHNFSWTERGNFNLTNLSKMRGQIWSCSRFIEVDSSYVWTVPDINFKTLNFDHRLKTKRRLCRRVITLIMIICGAIVRCNERVDWRADAWTS